MADPQACADCLPNDHHESSQPAQSITAVHNPLDPTTFVPPSASICPSITIEFCDRCRWLHRATWTSTELFLTFPTPAVKAINIMPLNAEDTAGRFRVWLFLDGKPPVLVWDRKVEGGFPELKVLKQRIRDHIQPGKSLGHSDK
ncbi:Rdx family-domain-containing protein [Earliella scabrosa]|nr:Rdx family-domain-containing protein [Earliella scabrosa]